MPAKSSPKKEKAEKAEKATPSSGERRKKKGDAWPWWLYAFAGIALAVVFGGAFVGDGDGSGSSSKSKKAGGLSTVDFLKMATRLQEMTTIAATLQGAGELDEEVADELNRELQVIEKKIDGSDDKISRDLASMVSVVRGTLFQQAKNLTDEQVENLTNSYTYANPRYWDQYYNKTSGEESYDWYVTWDSPMEDCTFAPYDEGDKKPANVLKDLLQPYLGKAPKLLMFGCGNSDMSEKMYDGGFEDIVNIDVSEAVMDRMRAKHETARPKMTWLQMDASKLTFADGTFDVTLDKGTLDAIEQNRPLTLGAIKEAHRTLKPGGLFISVTFNKPEVRIGNQLAEVAKWGPCYTHPFIKPPMPGTGGKGGERKQYYFHVCKK